MSLFATVAEQLLFQWENQSVLEIVAVTLSIGYIFFASRASIWCWPCALLSTGIFTFLFFDVNLLQESALNVYYLGMAVYGWWHWRGDDNASQRPIIRWNMKRHLVIIFCVAVVALVSGWTSDNWLNADFPYLNGFTVWFSVFTTYLVARKVFENWFYWLVINPTSFYILFQKELYLTCALMVVYFVMSIYGIFEWYRQWKKQSNEQSFAMPG
ncbi:MAG: nicotinamide mononucleotide transporter [Gammaproteobacteria bacterium]|nr:nicotinamide mononucleotide transporter [Gammaproteobacteria bacterium]